MSFQAGAFFRSSGNAVGCPNFCPALVGSCALDRPWDIAGAIAGSRADGKSGWSPRMARIVFTANVQRHVACPEAQAPGRTVREVLDNAFADNPQARGYVLDDQSALRRHMTIFVDGQMIRDRTRLADAVTDTSTIHVF